MPETKTQRLIDWALAEPAKGDLFPLFSLLLIIACFAWQTTWQKSNTVDEYVHILAGEAAWKHQDYRFNPENGTLPSRIAALPLQFTRSVPPLDTSSPLWTRSNQWELGRKWWFETGLDFRKALNQAHLAILLFNLVGIGLVFFYSSLLWGRGGGYLSLFIIGFSPNFLGHLPLATSDFAGTWTLVLATVSFALMLRGITPTGILAAGLGAGLALLCKHSALLLGPVALLLLLWQSFVNQPISFQGFGRNIILKHPVSRFFALLLASLLAALICCLLIWSTYSFRYAAANPQAGEFQQFQIAWNQLPEIGIISFFRHYQLLPEAFLYGLNFILGHASRGGYLNGVYSENGFLFYHFWTYLYKTPLPVILLHLLALSGLIAACWRKNFRSPLSTTGRALLLLGLAGLMMLLTTRISIGHRHAFTLVYMLAIATGICVPWALKHRPINGLIIALLALSLVPLAWVHRERSIAYTNWIGGGTTGGYQRLVDSSLDWGQDLPSAIVAINRYKETHPDKDSYLAYFGSADPLAYGLKSTHYLRGWGGWQRPEWVPEPTPGIYLFSATALVTTRQDWTMAMEAGYQTLHFRAAPLYARLQTNAALPVDKAAQLLTSPEVHILEDYEYLRYQRLITLMKNITPKDNLHGSIFLYELDLDTISTFNGEGSL